MLYEAQRQRQNAGLYDKPTLDQDECQRILFEGGYPRLAHLCKENDLPYPYINDEGEIETSESWWSSLRIPKT